jgi:F-box and WD-40 domain protein CDC4
MNEPQIAAGSSTTPSDHARSFVQKPFLDPSFLPRHQSIQAHGKKLVTALHLDHDNIISASDDHTVNIYDTQTAQLKHTLLGHSGGVWAIQYADGQLVTGSTDKTVRVWDVQTAKCTHVFIGHNGTVRCLKIVLPQRRGSGNYVPEQGVIVTGSRDKKLYVWKLPSRGTTYLPVETAQDGIAGAKVLNSENPYYLRKMEGHTHSIRSLAADGDIAVSGSYDSTVRVWTISTGECLWMLKGHTAKVYSVVYDPVKHRVYSGSMDHTIKVWDLVDGTLLSTLEGIRLYLAFLSVGHKSLVGLMELSTSLVSAAADAQVRIWNTDTLECEYVIDLNDAVVNCFHVDEDKLICGSRKGVMIWDPKTGKLIRTLLDGISSTWMVKFDDRRCVAAVQRDGVCSIEVFSFVEDAQSSGKLREAERSKL